MAVDRSEGAIDYMTVTWELFGIAVLIEFNARTRKWLEVYGSCRRRTGTKATTWGQPSRIITRMCMKNALTHGFHTRQLFHVSDGKAKPLRSSR
ncbi:hypothetical protein XI03_31315 [Bradyrhizobium sp. CCBAU 65884]|uniref:hypothetical protein n=1 Tax=Bradyrhizobium sp. CCBAU 65884 TaxID=722477 RepID=UPI002306B7DC|nr:hypothetical protein [Bradyrhizobium sp. CCBAU 65884]MDA9478899.1 hypothetical protein [Bradyrhizobium sp. CCBAU 65884]